MADNEGYTIKDRIAILADTISTQFTSIITQLDKIESKLDGKASNERVATLERSMADLEVRTEKRLATLEARDVETGEFSRRQLAWASIGVMLFVGLISYIVHLASIGAHP